MLVDAGKNHLLPDVAGRHVPPNILLIYERALAGDNKSVSCPIKPKRNRKLLFTSSWSPSMKQSLTSVLIADTSSFLDTDMNLENCEKVGSAMRATYISFYRKRFSELHHQINLAQLLFFHKRIFYRTEKKKECGKTERKVRKPRDVFHHVYMKRGYVIFL